MGFEPLKIEFSSQRREMLLSLITNMAALTSRANQQYSQLSSKTFFGTATKCLS